MMAGWRSYWDGHSRAPIRVGIALVAGIEWFVECIQVGWQSQDPEHFMPRGDLAQWLATLPGAVWVIYGMIAAGLWALASDRRPIVGGLWALAWAALLSEWQTQIFGSPSRNAFFPGAAVAGWVLGELWAHAVADERDTTPHRVTRERLGEVGVLGCIAAAYVGSGLSKLLASGAGWADGAQIRALVLWQQPVADWAWIEAYRSLVLQEPAVAVAASVATLVIETGALVLLLGPRARLAWTVAILGLHINIIVLCTMPYLEPMALLLLVAVPWPRVLGRTPAPEPEVPSPYRDVTMPRSVWAIMVGIVLLAWAAAPWGWRGEDPAPARAPERQ